MYIELTDNLYSFHSINSFIRLENTPEIIYF